MPFNGVDYFVSVTKCGTYNADQGYRFVVWNPLRQDQQPIVLSGNSKQFLPPPGVYSQVLNYMIAQLDPNHLITSGPIPTSVWKFDYEKVRFRSVVPLSYALGLGSA